MGEIDLAALLAAAGDPDPGKARGQLCEARFFAGELALLNGGKDAAEGLFRLAASECPNNFLRWSAATVELRALGRRAVNPASLASGYLRNSGLTAE